MKTFWLLMYFGCAAFAVVCAAAAGMAGEGSAIFGWATAAALWVALALSKWERE